ncbi:MAG: DedA family protein, partial [Bdellovibrionales bacterium]|nr:DedA family protein [Bdellovibrionales bacterium]
LGNMNGVLVVLAGSAGSLVGALINYYLSLYLGRTFILKYGKYFFFGPDKFEKLENAFLAHGSFATLVGRLIFGIRQWISIPAGLSKMPLKRFSLLTTLGASVWVAILVLLGYILGESQKANEYAKLVGYWLLAVVFIMTVAYLYWWSPRKRSSNGVVSQPDPHQSTGA